MMDLFEEYSNEELLKTNVAFLGLIQGAWDFSRGARTERLYTCPDTDGFVHVRDYYEYVMVDGSRTIDSYTRKLQWFNVEGEVALEKDITPVLNIKNKKRLNRDIRQGRIDYMIAAAEELNNLAAFVLEPYKSDFLKANDSIDLILKQYESEITHYIDTGSREFENAIINEDNPILVEVLSLGVRPPDELFPSGLTIKQSILHQLTGVY